MAITKLSETSSDQVRTLLENCGVKSIKERATWKILILAPSVALMNI